jgi:phosphinothricin acetyltransferase
MIIRPATRRDVPAALAILNDEIRSDVNAFDTEPVEGAAQDRWFTAHADPRFPLFIADHDGVVRGWACLSPWARHGAYARTAELSVFIHAGHRRQGIGKALLRRMIDEGRVAGHHVLVGRAEASNEASRRLHRSCGFSETGLMREVGWKHGRYLDVAIFQIIL